MADDPGPPLRRRLGRRQPIELVALDDAPATESVDAVEVVDPAASYVAAEVDAAAEAASIAAALDPTGSGPEPLGPPLRRRLGRRAASASGPSISVAAVDGRAGRPTEVTEPTELAEPTEPAEPRPAWLPMLDDRSPNVAICPFLRAIDDQGGTRPPAEQPDPTNRCAALREPVPQSLRQQELVCLSAGHVNCPRYLRGAVAASEVPTAAIRAGRAATPAVLGSIAVLALAFTASVAFVLTRGGLDLTAAVSPPPSASAVAAVPTPDPTIAPTVGPVATPTPAPTPAPTFAPAATPGPSPSPSPTPTPAPTPSPAPTPEPTATPAPTSDRYALLRPCPDTPRCWIYTVRRGDNLFSIANYFGVSLESIYDRNAWTRTQSLRAGRELRLPPPTR